MEICYIDEDGCTGRLPSPTSDVQPILVICGMIVEYSRLARITERFLEVKEKYYPIGSTGPTTYLGGILKETKGSELRKLACAPARNQRRHTFGYLDRLFEICEEADIKIIGRVWVKGINQPFNGTSVYTSSIQAICANFQRYLVDKEDLGIVVADSRVKSLNTGVAHSIFTQKFKSSGDVFDRIPELPTFAHSDNHACLQITDNISSGIVLPMAMEAFCRGHINSVHTKYDYSKIRERYSETINDLQYRYQEASGRYKGGLVVSDSISKSSGTNLFYRSSAQTVSGAS